MKKFVIAGLIALSASAAYAILPPVLANVNGTDVTKAEIEKAFAGMAMDQPGQAKITFDKTPPDFQKAFVEKYIEKLLILEAARKAKLEDDAEVKAKLKEAEDFLIQQKFLTDLVMKKNNDAVLKKIYDDKLKDKEGKEEIHAFHILVKTEDEAKKVRESLTNGGDFDKLAKQKSLEPGAKVNGGDLGYFTEDQMVPDFSKAAFALKKGEISQPVQTPFGWHVIKVVDKRAKKIPTFAESKAALQKQLADDVIEDEVKRLKIAADIKYFGTLAKEPPKPDVKPLIKKLDDTKPDDAKAPADKKTDDVKTSDKKANDVKSDDAKSVNKKTDDVKAPDKKADDVKSDDKKTDDKKPDVKKDDKPEVKKPDVKPAAPAPAAKADDNNDDGAE